MHSLTKFTKVPLDIIAQMYVWIFSHNIENDKPHIYSVETKTLACTKKIIFLIYNDIPKENRVSSNMNFDKDRVQLYIVIVGTQNFTLQQVPGVRLNDS